jgi:hypothetical protein
VLVVGNAARPDAEPVESCAGDHPSPERSVYVSIYDYTLGVPITRVPGQGAISPGAEIPRTRPADFATGRAIESLCPPARSDRRGRDHVQVFLPFESSGRVFTVIVASTVDLDGSLLRAGVRVINTLQDDRLVLLIPDPVPTEFRLLQVRGLGRHGQPVGTGVDGLAGSNEWKREQLWIRLDRTRTRPVGVLELDWGPGATAIRTRPGRLPPTDPLEGFRHVEVPAPGQDPPVKLVAAPSIRVRGRPGLYRPDRSGFSHPPRNAIVWEEPHGQAVLVSGTFSRGELQSIARHLKRTAQGNFTLSQPPAGFSLVSDAPGFKSLGTNSRAVIYAGGPNRGFQVHITEHSDFTPGLDLSWPGARLVTVRGHHAVITPEVFAQPGSFDTATLFMLNANRFLEWIERPGIRVTISGVGLTDAELLNLARHLRSISPTAWQQLAEQP